MKMVTGIHSPVMIKSAWEILSCKPIIGHCLGASAAVELADVAATETVRRVLLPSSVDRFEPGLAELLAGFVQAPVITAPGFAHVA